MKTSEVLPSREVLRRNVMDRLDKLPDECVAVLHDLALELEMRAAWQEFSQGMAADWAAGKYERLDEAIREARAAIRARK